MAAESLGKMLLYIGIVLVLIGAFFILTAKLPWFGRLPGDFVWKKESATIFIPVTTMLLVSIILTLLLNIIWRR
jgi:hypothetical protein